MKHVTLIRHAKSSWEEGVTDFERPLNARGRLDAPRMGGVLASLRIQPKQMISSPARRALTTAQLMASAMHLGSEQVRTERRLYEASSRQICQVLSEVKDDVSHVALVGHNPGMSDCVKVLVGKDADDFPTCGVAHLELKIDTWAEVFEGCGRLLRFLTPKTV